MYAKGLVSLASFWTVAMLLGWTSGEEVACLQDEKHKDVPGPEPELQECQLYSGNACCMSEEIEELGLTSGLWDQCRSPSPRCEDFLKRLSCFYYCSPDAALWSRQDPQTADSESTMGSLHLIQSVPLCLTFCQQWFEACQDDLTCTRTSNWTLQGQNCSTDCVTYRQMYSGGLDLCETMFGSSFRAELDESSCGCLHLNASDQEVTEKLRVEYSSNGELDTTKLGEQLNEPSCHRQIRPASSLGEKTGSSASYRLHRRAVAPSFIEDIEGSGSGF
ncbi:retbindin [Polypterus senegalus]|nr:retbindin [Polypterus senegalus]